MFPPETCGDTPNAISSPGSADGVSPSPLPDGLPTDLFGLPLAPASPSARREKAKEGAMIATSGPCFTGLSPSSSLSESLGNRLRRLLDSTGSMEYRQTWKRMATRSGRLYWAHIASARPTSGSDFTGWPTPQVAQGPNMSTNRGEGYGGRRERVTPQSVEGILTGWPTPATDDSGVSVTARGAHTGQSLIDQSTGLSPDSSPAGTGKSAAFRLNPLFSLWLMGFEPAAWLRCAERAMQSFRKPRRRSSGLQCGGSK